MPSLPAVPKGVRIDFHFTMPGDPNIQWREFFQYPGTLSLADAQTWVNAIATAMTVFLTAASSTDLTLVLTELTDLTSTSAPQVTSSTSGSGANAAAILPAGTAMVLRKHIARRYRGGHPRVYVAGLTQAELLTPNTWTTTATAGTVTAYSTLIASIAGTAPTAVGTPTHVNISYFHGFTPFTYPSGRVKNIPNQRPTPFVDSITGASANASVASQRRRNEQP